MDVLSHGLWAGAGATALNRKAPGRFSFWKAFAWGVAPDLFAFTLPFALLFFSVATGALGMGELPGAQGIGTPTPGNETPAFVLAESLYAVSHSLVVFAAVFGLLFVLLRRAVWEMLGWLLHILTDIPTHPPEFFPTPLFWPVSDWKFLGGFSWATPWFLALNWGTLFIIYLFLRDRTHGRDERDV